MNSAVGGRLNRIGRAAIGRAGIIRSVQILLALAAVDDDATRR